MKVVYKYPLGDMLALKDEVSLIVPLGAQYLTVAVQGDQLCLWALVDTDERKVTRKFRIAGTGHPIEEVLPIANSGYIGTVHWLGLVFHIFEFL